MAYKSSLKNPSAYMETLLVKRKQGCGGVANAARTRDLLNHNQVLYQLSYSHHGESTRDADQCNR